MKRLGIGLLLALALPLGGKVNAADQGSILEDVLSICANLSTETQSVQSALLESGWLPEDDKTKTIAALMSQTMTFDFAYRTEESASRGQELTGPAALYSFIQLNGSFMAASMLGNSGTSMELPTFSKARNSLSVRGIASGSPSCLLSGPDILFDVVTNHPRFQTKPNKRLPDQPQRGGGEVAYGFIQSLETFATRLDIAQLSTQSAAAGVPFEPHLKELLMPVVISLRKPEATE